MSEYPSYSLSDGLRGRRRALPTNVDTEHMSTNADNDAEPRPQLSALTAEDRERLVQENEGGDVESARLTPAERLIIRGVVDEYHMPTVYAAVERIIARRLETCTGPGRCTAGYWCPLHGPTSRRWENRNGVAK